MKEQLLNYEAHLTIIAESEKILNDRTICQVNDDCRDPEPLSPNKLLLLCPNQSLPPGVFDKSDLNYRFWWRQVQYLTGVFWKRLIKEYLPTLQARQKWQEPGQNTAKMILC